MMGIKEKSAGFRAEFKKFVMRGNVIDLAVGVIIGGAFATITNSLVNDCLLYTSCSDPARRQGSDPLQ